MSSRVFLGDTSDFVPIAPEQMRTVTLEDMCRAFEVDATGAFVLRAHSGAVVATRPTDTLPEIGPNVDYILRAAGVGSSSNADGQQQQQQSGNSIERVVLKMGQLINTMAGDGAVGSSGSSHIVVGTAEDLEEIDLFFASQQQQQSATAAPTSAKDIDLRRGRDASDSDALARVMQRAGQNAMFISSCDTAYHPHTVSHVVASMPRKAVSEAKYSFDVFN